MSTHFQFHNLFSLRFASLILQIMHLIWLNLSCLCGFLHRKYKFFLHTLNIINIKLYVDVSPK